MPSLPEWHDAALLRREKWPPFAEALRAVQAPAELPGAACRSRLAYDELLADQVALAVVRGRLRARRGRGLEGDGSLQAKALARFGYTLTRSQAQALAEIDADLASDRRMLRLLQGDVGSGKTRGGAAGHAARGGGRQAGGHHGADRGAGEAASPHAVAPVAGARRVADRRREGARAGAACCAV